LLFSHPILNLGLLHPQHPANLRRRQVLVEQLRDLLQREAEVLQGENAVEPGQLVERVVAIAGEAIDLDGLEQPDFVVVTQRLHRHAADSRKVSDLDHAVRGSARRTVRPKNLLTGYTLQQRESQAAGGGYFLRNPSAGT